MNLPPILRPSFWFDLTPVAMSPVFERVFFVFFALFVVAGAAMRIATRSTPREKYEVAVRMRAANIAFVYGLVGFVIYFLTFEEIQFFGARFWYLVWAAALVVSVVRLVRWWKKEVPLLRKAEQSKAEANKYLPRSNRR